MTDSEEEVLPEKAEGVFPTLVSDGQWLLLKREFKRAKHSFTTALALKPGNKECLVERSKCCLNMGQLQKALKDAEQSLANDPSYPEGLHQKAEALYYMGEFEFTLVFYHRGKMIRPQGECFRLGIQKAQEAIENAVGSPSFVKLRIKGDLSFLKKEEERARPISVIEHLLKEKKQEPVKFAKNEPLAKHLLKDFYEEKSFLESLMKDESLTKGKTKTGEHVHDIIQGCLVSLGTYIEFSNQENVFSSENKQCQMEQKFTAASKFEQYLVRSINHIETDLLTGNTGNSLKKAEAVMKMLQRWSEKDFPQWKQFAGSLHSCIGNALRIHGEMEKSLEHHKLELELAIQCKLPDAESRALDNLGRAHAQNNDFEQAIVLWKKRIPLVHGEMEKIWLYHEIGRFYLELGLYDEAKDYGNLSLTEAEKIPDEKWQMNANVLMGQAELKSGNIQTSITRYEKALVYSKILEDDTAQSAIKKALVEAKHSVVSSLT